jgi:CDP-diglyceride synthetase
MMKSSHAKRWITGIIAVPILFSIIYFSTEAVFAGFVLVVTVVAVLEYSRLAFGKEGLLMQRALLLFGLLAPLAAALSGQGAIFAVAVLSSLTVFILYLFSTK